MPDPDGGRFFCVCFIESLPEPEGQGGQFCFMFVKIESMPEPAGQGGQFFCPGCPIMWGRAGVLFKTTSL